MKRSRQRGDGRHRDIFCCQRISDPSAELIRDDARALDLNAFEGDSLVESFWINDAEQRPPAREDLAHNHGGPGKLFQAIHSDG